ncbi:MAG: hypothetical protein JO110_02305, partial [Acetobacteraceae bacterium]|nr:hypothetical protein [Acetobacteraceae bacterium]
MMRFEFKGQTYCKNLSAAERATIRQFLQGVAGKRTTPGSSLTIEDGVLMYEQTAIAWINRAGELWGGIPSG